MLNNNESAEYREIPGHAGYFAGSDGTIWSAWSKGYRKRIVDERIQLSPSRTQSGYLRVSIAGGGRKSNHFVHRLVLLAFVGECPEGMECRHMDNNPANNRVGNIMWATRSVNQLDKRANGTSQQGEGHGLAKLTEADVKNIRRDYATGEFTQRQLASRYRVTQTLIWMVLKRIGWKHVNETEQLQGA